MKRLLSFLVICALVMFMVTPAVQAEDGTTPGVGPVTTLTANVSDLSLTAAPEGTATGSISLTAPADATVSVSSDSDWLTVTPASLQGSGTVTVTVSAKGKTPGEVLLGTITLNGGSSGTVVVPVVVTVATVGNVPMLSANPARLDLNSLEANKTSIQKLTLEFAVPLSGTVSTDTAWMEVLPKTFSNATKQVVIIKVNTNNLINGQFYSGNVEVRSGNNPTLAVPVIFKIGNAPPPKRVFKSTFRDLPDDHWAIEAIMTLVELKVISGVGNGLYAPDKFVTREQFAKLLTGALQLLTNPAPATPSFTDVPADRWSASYIETVKPYLTGFKDGLFRPEAQATREDMAVALVRAKGFDKAPPGDPADLDAIFSDAAKISPAVKALVAIAVEKGLMKGFDDGTFRPQEPLTRAQAAVLLFRASQVGGNEKSSQ